VVKKEQDKKTLAAKKGACLLFLQDSQGTPCHEIQMMMAKKTQARAA
jgi:hypothetical protein